MMHTRTSYLGSYMVQTRTLPLSCAGVYARPLGNVVYLMATPTTAKSRCDGLLRRLLASL